MLTRQQLQALDDWLLSQQNIDRQIRIRRLELETKHAESNIKSNRPNRHVETVAIRLADDQVLKGLENLKNAIQELEKFLEDKNYSDLLVIYRLRYKEKLMWEEIEDRLNLSRKTVYRRRESILKLFGEFVGVYYDIS
ncbi:TPA: hypothetical protein ACGO2H_001134 [Streptococcus suis]|uniref:hypothetical protein n=1 Tax=Streptococcus suis TaxID=1307 RepID=UPI003706B190